MTNKFNKLILKTVRGITIFAILFAIAQQTLAQNSDNKLFPYPVVPEEKVLLSERCNFLVDHFWDRCNMKQAFSSKQRLSEAFGDWVSFMPYASADTVHMAIDRFIANFKKQPKNLVTIANIAQTWLYTDSAEFTSEELYLPFAEAVASNKKVSSTDRAIFATQAHQLASSKTGDVAPSFRMTTPDGYILDFNDVEAPAIILFFNDPDCSDCRLARLRLETDFNAKQLIEKGALKIVSVYPGDPSEQWAQAAESYPQNWIVGASPDVDLIFTIPNSPTLYFLDGQHKILGKNLVIDNILNALRILNTPTTQQ